VLLGALPILIVGAILGWVLAHRVASDNFKRLTDDVTAFTPYYFSGAPPANFVLNRGSLNYQDGVLVFGMTNSKDSSKTLAFTEQRTPANYDISGLQGDKEFKTTYGQAFITDGTSRTTGTLFTDTGTWILINAPIPIGADAMVTTLNSLQPAR
jgi:hypothetical protein